MPSTRGPDGGRRPGPGAYRRRWDRAAEIGKRARYPRLFTIRRAEAHDRLLATLAAHGPLASTDLYAMLGSPALRDNIAYLTAKGLVTRGRIVGHRGRRGVLLDPRHPGAEHLEAYLKAVAAECGVPPRVGDAPRLTRDLAPLPVKPGHPFGALARTQVLLALSLAAELKIRDLAAICAKPAGSPGFRHVVRRLWLLGLVTATEQRGADYYASLNAKLPGAIHLRRFLKATAKARYRHIVLAARVTLRNDFDDD